MTFYLWTFPTGIFIKAEAENDTLSLADAVRQMEAE